MRKISISLSNELDSALTLASIDKKENKSHLIEVFLRENPRVQNYVKAIEAEPKTNVFAAHTAQEKKEIYNKR